MHGLLYFRFAKFSRLSCFVLNDYVVMSLHRLLSFECEHSSTIPFEDSIAEIWALTFEQVRDVRF